MSDNIQLYRMINDRIPESGKRRLLLLTGARQTGKTTLAKSKYPDLRYINLDAPENREAIRQVSSSLWAKDIGRAVLDEAQKEPVIFDKIKYAFDEGALTFSVLLGSSQILLLKKIRETLAGRVSIFELWPLMMCEIFNNKATAPETMPLVDDIFSPMAFDDIFGNQPSVLLAEEMRGAETRRTTSCSGVGCLLCCRWMHRSGFSGSKIMNIPISNGMSPILSGWMICYRLESFSAWPRFAPAVY